ncbi:Hsp20/alpha crystallin family protein [Paracoccus benzoatiresistens]|uniref:Hsp20/alpha crystallin family protein n=1 Tax=Paracoccus benzoatiresistens TaxID=2997341 RepID=A0ABT4J7T4_9RHOB|nr:Hsp20/alpha crystallin family protein [Paracoccus sp. EF6]MCZ0963190.1 Hsp20/alpha crystallin family protein [Paracoccus sp. EF6]
MTKNTQVSVSQAPRASGLDPDIWPGFGNLRSEMDRLFEVFEPRGWFGRSLPALGQDLAALRLAPAVDLVEKNGGYELSAELPGLDAENVEVKLAGGVLTIRGEKKEAKDEERKDYHLSERRWGSFLRQIRLPEDVDDSKIEASFANGVLTVSLPKSEKAIAAEKKIEIRAA